MGSLGLPHAILSVISPSGKMPNNKRQGKGKRGKVSPIPLFTTTGRPATREVLAYHQTGTLTEAAAGAGSYNTFRLNSIYDPDFSGVGSSAVGYSTKALFYGKYKVLRVRFCVRFWGSTGGNALVGVMFGGNTTIAANPLLWAVEPNSHSKMLQGNTGTTHSVVTLDMTVPIHKVVGITKKQFDVDLDYQASFGVNPQLQAYATIWVFGQSAAAQTVVYDVRVAFDTEFSQPLQAITA